ncbi:MAG: hypothetical protein WBP75_06250 [Candidatus Cybelea sp.]
MRDLRKDGTRGCVTDSWDRRQQVAPTLKIGVIVEVLTDLALDLCDLLVERLDDLPNRVCNDG